MQLHQSVRTLTPLLFGLGSWLWLFGVDEIGIRNIYISNSAYIAVSFALPVLGIFASTLVMKLGNDILATAGLIICFLALAYISLTLLFLGWKIT